MTKKWLLLMLALLGAPATAGYIVTLKEVGSDVVATGSGPIDLTGLSDNGSQQFRAQLNPHAGSVITGPSVLTAADRWFSPTFTGPTNFGPASQTLADSGSGDLVALFVGSGVLVMVPSGYASNDPLFDTSTYLNEDFTSLGVTPGTYMWTWGTGENQNFTLVIEEEDTPVPAPATLALLGLGLAGLG